MRDMRCHIFVGGTSTLGQALLTWSHTFNNFTRTMKACRYFGWTEATISEPCSWGGSRCASNSANFSLSLRNIGLEGRKARPVLLPLTCLRAWPGTWSAYKFCQCLHSCSSYQSFCSLIPTRHARGTPNSAYA